MIASYKNIFENDIFFKNIKFFMFLFLKKDVKFKILLNEILKKAK